MIFLGILVSFAAIGTMCWLLFNLAVFALPFFAGVTLGTWAYGTGAGWLGATVIGLAGAGRCSKDSGEEMREWFAPRIKEMLGGERKLAQSLEGVGTCGALREHVGAKALAQWAEAHPAR